MVYSIIEHCDQFRCEKDISQDEEALNKFHHDLFLGFSLCGLELLYPLCAVYDMSKIRHKEAWQTLQRIYILSVIIL